MSISPWGVGDSGGLWQRQPRRTTGTARFPVRKALSRSVGQLFEELDGGASPSFDAGEEAANAEGRRGRCVCHFVALVDVTPAVWFAFDDELAEVRWPAASRNAELCGEREAAVVNRLHSFSPWVWGSSLL